MVEDEEGEDPPKRDESYDNFAAWRGLFKHEARVGDDVWAFALVTDEDGLLSRPCADTFQSLSRREKTGYEGSLITRLFGGFDTDWNTGEWKEIHPGGFEE